MSVFVIRLAESCRVHHKYATVVGDVIILHMVFMFLEQCVICYSGRLTCIMDTNMSLQVSLVCLLHLTVCVVDNFC